MNTKKIIYIMLAAVLTLTTACTDNFDKTNSDPNKVEKIDPAYLFTRTWMRYNGSPHEELRSNLIMAGPLSGILQSAYRTGQGFEGNNDGYNEAKMMEMYKDAVKHGVDMLQILKTDTENDNTAKIAMGTITMQFVYQRITDLYGDIPYHEAGLGFHEGIFYPAYDSQEDIYKSSVDSLKKYRDILLTTDAEPFTGTEDIFFGGLSQDAAKQAWAKTANSLILRLGMRASAADESWAQETVEEAAANQAGLITSIEIADGFIMQTKAVGGDWGNHINGANSGGALHGWGHGYIGEEWLREAQKNRDPRIFYTVAQVINNSGWKAWTGMPDYDAFAQASRPGEPWKPVTYMPVRAGGTESYSIRGMMSVDGDRLFADWTVELDTSATGSPEYVQYHTVASVNPETIGHQEAPIVVFGGDETYYILAEAAQRGWSVPGDVNSNLEMALNMTFDKYPTLFGTESNSPREYMAKQAAHEGVNIDYNDMASVYINNIMSETIDLEVIWTERWKSMMSTFTYDAFALWNRTNLEIVPQGISYPGTEFMEIPSYTAEEVANPQLGVAIPASDYTSEPFHNGGDTGGTRPRRINYPNNERTNNTEHVEAAMARQQAEYGRAGSGTHFITTNMWISKKN
ncbi:SusD/RagB family nutrient-binding outer membrane lipoprotein [Saccharicrinis aurantiacus]|uniref:SusD/RagB family nutrient-binding outer membrane lipoprotein n=1 Tax=Saccharicrinis aurantiacus TaxID=1849719 RepID=UPI000837C0B6|nr:SusD/RagB family nutrient-binding outer membrane lipoprotein [Saccharicrinis aurantiacus]